MIGMLSSNSFHYLRILPSKILQKIFELWLPWYAGNWTQCETKELRWGWTKSPRGDSQAKSCDSENINHHHGVTECPLKYHDKLCHKSLSFTVSFDYKSILLRYCVIKWCNIKHLSEYFYANLFGNDYLCYYALNLVSQ